MLAGRDSGVADVEDLTDLGQSEPSGSAAAVADAAAEAAGIELEPNATDAAAAEAIDGEGGATMKRLLLTGLMSLPPLPFDNSENLSEGSSWCGGAWSR